jgi:hypothetical protein
MKYVVCVIIAHPDYKRPDASVKHKVFSTLTEVEEYKREVALSYKHNFLTYYYVEKFGMTEEEFYEKVDENDTLVDVFEDDDGSVADYVYSDSYMDMPPIEFRVMEVE